MNLGKKKQLAARTFNVGKEKIVFLPGRIAEIKEAITKQDMKDLLKDGAILIKQINGRKTIYGRKRKRGVGKIRKKVNKSKREYIITTRKLRKYSKDLLKQGRISKKDYKQLRLGIRNREFKNKTHLNENFPGIKNK